MVCIFDSKWQHFRTRWGREWQFVRTTDCSVIGVVVAVGMVGVNCGLGFPLNHFAGKKVNNVESRG